MKNKHIRNAFFIICTVVLLLIGCQKETEKDIEPVKQGSFFELLGIDSEKVDQIHLSYQSDVLDPGSSFQIIKELDAGDPLYSEIVTVFDKLQLTLNEEYEWDEIKSRYRLGSTQISFVSNNEEYQIQLLDVYQKQNSKPIPITWAIVQDTYIYTVDYSQCWEKTQYQGVALYLDRLKETVAENEDDLLIDIPMYYGLVQNAASWNFDCNASSIYEKSDYIFKGKVLENDFHSGYQIQVLESFKGEWESGYIFRYQDGTGYDIETKTYHALVNETEKPLIPENEYIFFMRKNWMVDPTQVAEGYEAVFLTDRQCGVCEIVDDQVWPIFNALPETSWYTGQSVGEIRDICQSVNAGTEDSEVSLQKKSFETVNTAIADLGIELLKRNVNGDENILASPLSVMSVIGMAANGAEGETKSQIEDAIGISVEKLNECFEEYLGEIEDDHFSAVIIANAIIYKENSFVVEESFVELVENAYCARMSEERFDKETLEELNRWVYKQTNRRIPQILDQIEENEVIYLINALSFDAKWAKKFQTVKQLDFTMESGKAKSVNMMFGRAERYIEDNGTIGFIKNYEDPRYVFMALLPEEGVTVSEYMDSLTGEKIEAYLQEAREVTVDLKMPEYEYEYSAGLKETMSAMGMSDLFDAAKADLSKMGECTDGNLFLNRVIHKTYINVNTSGTKGGAATLGGGVSGGGTPQEVKIVKLDRPFIYLVMDCESELPVFMGTVMDPSTVSENY